MPEIETHPLGFFLPSNTKILMLGSFPPPRKRWSMDFFYPNFQNDMWRILGSIFFHEKDQFVIKEAKKFDIEAIRQFCQQYGIALGDTAQKVIRLKDNASDNFLEIVEPIPLKSILSQITHCLAIVITGQKAMDTLRTVITFNEPKVGTYATCTLDNREIRIYRMPSSSRAYPKPINEKTEIYKQMFSDLQMI